MFWSKDEIQDEPRRENRRKERRRRIKEGRRGMKRRKNIKESVKYSLLILKWIITVGKQGTFGKHTKWTHGEYFVLET